MEEEMILGSQIEILHSLNAIYHEVCVCEDELKQTVEDEQTPIDI